MRNAPHVCSFHPGISEFGRDLRDILRSALPLRVCGDAPPCEFFAQELQIHKKIKFAPQLYPADGALYIAAPVLAGVSFSVFLWRQSAAIPSAEALITAGSFSCADSALSDHRKTACSCTHRQQLRCGCTGIHVRRDAAFVPFRSFGTDARCLFHHRVHSILQSA